MSDQQLTFYFYPHKTKIATYITPFCTSVRISTNAPNQIIYFRCPPIKACILVWPDGYQGVSKYDYM